MVRYDKGEDPNMYAYWLETMANDRIDTLRREATERRMVAESTPATEPIRSRLYRRLAPLLRSAPTMSPRPRACVC
ncbi:MAG: hypothetical protein CL424_17410 [Acidimicrobiaceae bacterium]|nr:hypothetical protein [Acidimicrobiaceae bacterium]